MERSGSPSGKRSRRHVSFSRLCVVFFNLPHIIWKLAFLRDNFVMLLLFSVPTQRDGDDYHRERDRERDRRKRHKEKHSLHIPSSGTEPKGGEAVTPTTPTGGGMASDISTKVLYYMHNEKAETPYVMTIPKK